ncbi:hypothetical protein ACIQGZ_03830 [Streptomyces sp. NPDC092296]|uniref:hypothetical protein n=1 Tax=Streptomyces sp. NPDC092296 TaxID=3366012 RepID=UPI003830A516
MGHSGPGRSRRSPSWRWATVPTLPLLARIADALDVDLAIRMAPGAEMAVSRTPHAA